MRLFTAHPLHAYLAAGQQQLTRSTVAPNSPYSPPPPTFPAPKRRRVAPSPSDAIAPGMSYHSNNENEGFTPDQMNAGYDVRRGIEDVPIPNGYNSRPVPGNGDAGVSGSQSRHNLRPSRQVNAPGPSLGPGPGYQPGPEEHGNQTFGLPFPPPAGPNAFGDNALQRPFVPPPPPFPGDPFAMFNPMWNNFYGMNAGANPDPNSLPFMPPLFFPSPVLQGPMNGFPPYPGDPSAFGAFNGFTQPGMLDPTETPEAPRSPSKSPVPPEPASEYLTQALEPPKRLPVRQQLLVILDLNGTLIYRKSRKYPPTFTKRAGLDQFLGALLKRYKVMVWSSSQPHTVRGVCEKLFSPEQRKKLVVEWGRDMFGLSRSQYSAKTQVYKKLDTVWSSDVVQASYLEATAKPPGGKFAGKKKRRAFAQAIGQRWDQTNTVLIDDSKLKALSEPYNIIEIPEFTNDTETDESGIFPNVLNRLEILSGFDDTSKVLRHLSENPKLGSLNHFPICPSSLDAVHQPQQPTEPTLSVEEKKEAKKARKRERKAAHQLADEADKGVSTSTPATQTQGSGSQPAQQTTTTQKPSKTQKRAAARLKQKKEKAARKRAAAAGGGGPGAVAVGSAGAGVGPGPGTGPGWWESLVTLIDGKTQPQQQQQQHGQQSQGLKQKQKQKQKQKPGKEQSSNQSSASSVPGYVSASSSGSGSGSGAGAGAGSPQSTKSENFLLDRLEASLDGH